FSGQNVLSGREQSRLRHLEDAHLRVIVAEEHRAARAGELHGTLAASGSERANEKIVEREVQCEIVRLGDVENQRRITGTGSVSKRGEIAVPADQAARDQPV